MSERQPLNIKVFEPNGRLREPAAAGVRGQLINALNDVYRDHHTARTEPTPAYLEAARVLETFPDELARLFETDSAENPYWIVAYLLRQSHPQTLQHLLHVEQQAAALSLLQQHLKTFLRHYLQGDLHPDQAGSVLRTLYRTGDQKAKDTILEAIRTGYPKTDSFAASQALSALLGEQTWDPAARQLIADHLLQTGLEPEPTLRAWQLAYQTSKNPTLEAERTTRAEYITKHLTTLDYLTHRDPSVPATLAARYGIRAFGRYRPAMLLEQFETREAPKEPRQGVVILPRTDHNGAMFSRASMLQAMQLQYRGIGNLRVIEADDMEDAAQRLQELRSQYGPIDFLLLGGHGSGKSLWLGQSDTLLPENKHLLGLNQLDALLGRSDRQRLFTKHPTIVLWSCKGGQDHGLAQAISYDYNALVIAAESVMDDGNIEFLMQPKRSYKTVVSYQLDGKPVPTRQYDRGVPLPASTRDQPGILDEQGIRSAIQQELTELALLKPWDFFEVMDEVPND